jgi:uncharacterized protein YcfJ
VGSVVGSIVGVFVGAAVGIAVGEVVGAFVGNPVGAPVTHTRFAHSVGATPSKCSNSHAVTAAQTKSEVGVQAVVMYSPASQLAPVVLQPRSAVVVPADDSYSFGRSSGQLPVHVVEIVDVSHTVYTAHVGPLACAP